MSLYGILHLSSVQTWIIKKATNSLSEQLHTKVSIDKVDFAFFNKLEFENLLIEDQKKDTLLFAGAMKVDLNDWFFAKDQIVLKYIGLENTLVNATRENSEWNYQFLVDFIEKSNKPKTKNKNTIAIDLKQLHLKNIKFNYIDKWIGDDMIGSIGLLDARFNKADFNKQEFNIEKIKIVDPYFAQFDYTGKRPSIINQAKKIIVHKNPSEEEPGINLSIKNIVIKNGLYQNDKETTRLPFDDQFDALHFQFKNISGEFNNVTFNKETLTAKLALKGKERNGFIVRKIDADVKFTPTIMEFKNLDLTTNNSHITNYYSMHYQSFKEDMRDFISKVKIESRFSNSEISSEDLSFFAPELKQWNKMFLLTGNAIGTIDNFETNELIVKSGKSIIKGNLKMKGLPDIDSTFISFNSSGSQSNANELAPIFPSLKNIKNPNLNNLGNVYFKGKFAGRINDFEIQGLFNSYLGNVSGNIKLKLPEKALPYYKGNLNATDFQIGQLIGSKLLDKISFNGAIEGRGFDTNNIDAKYHGFVSSIGINGYNYTSWNIDGNFENKTLKAQCSIIDSNLKTANINTSIYFGDKTRFKINGLVDYINFKNLNLSDQNISLSSNIDIDVTGTTLDEIFGHIKLDNSKLKYNDDLLSMHNLTLQSSINGEERKIQLTSNEINLSIDGQFKIQELPDAFKAILNKYYPTYIDLPKNITQQQHFSFQIKTNNIEDYLKIFNKKIKGFNNADINGHINLDDKEFHLQAKIPEFQYEDKAFTKINLQSNGDKNNLSTTVTVKDITLSDSIHFPETEIALNSTNDNTEIHVNTSATSTLNNADFNANVQTLNDGIKIHFYPSSFIINDKKWLLEKDGELAIRKNFMNANEIKFSHKDQQIVLTTELDEITNQSHLIATLTAVRLEDFIPFIFTNPSIKGAISGTAKISDPLGNATMSFTGKVDSLSLEDRLIGNINTNATANTNTGKIEYHVANIDTTNIFALDGHYNYKDSSENQLDANLQGERIHLSILEPYLEDVFSKIDGTASTHLKISGSPEHQFLSGNVQIENSALKVGYTQCRYFIKNQSINFDKNYINLNLIELKDSLNNSATLNGKIYHEMFDKITFDNISMETDKISLLNTDKNDNPQFYGNMIGRAHLNINGPINNLKMDINGEPSILDSSHIYINTSDSKENNNVDYIEFVQFGSRMEDLIKKAKNNIVVNLNIKANPACKVDVVLDEETGDVIKGQGNGLINIKVGNIEPLSIRGAYNLTKGEYTFNFQTFLKKPFTLNRGTITWNGDPYLALIDIDAEYLAKNVDISSLSPNLGLKKKEDLKIISHLTGALKNPLVKFDIQLPEKSDAKRDDIVVKRLAEFKNDENEMNKQVASLLLFNAIIVSNQNFLKQGAASSMLTNTVGGIISNLLTNFFNKELEKATKGILSTYIDINPTLDIQKNATQLQANIRAGLKILLSNRLNVLVGGNLDYNNPTYIQQLEKKGLITPDITIEWLINKDGSLRIVGFNRSSIDFTLSQRNRSGIQLSYRKDMNRLSDLFRSKKKITSEENNTKSPALKPKEK